MSNIYPDKKGMSDASKYDLYYENRTTNKKINFFLNNKKRKNRRVQ
jgi:hypothetical protein